MLLGAFVVVDSLGASVCFLSACRSLAIEGCGLGCRLDCELGCGLETEAVGVETEASCRRNG